MSLGRYLRLKWAKKKFEVGMNGLERDLRERERESSSGTSENHGEMLLHRASKEGELEEPSERHIENKEEHRSQRSERS